MRSAPIRALWLGATFSASLGASLALGAAAAAWAGDFAEFCSTADGAYGLEFLGGGAAVLIAREGGAAVAERPAEIANETILLSRQSECVDDRDADTRYTYSNLISVVTVEIDDGGAPQRISLICETHSSGVPAAATCSDDQVTHQTGLHAP